MFIRLLSPNPFMEKADGEETADPTSFRSWLVPQMWVLAQKAKEMGFPAEGDWMGLNQNRIKARNEKWSQRHWSPAQLLQFDSRFFSTRFKWKSEIVSRPSSKIWFGSEWN
jgi:hypothetical protein